MKKSRPINRIFLIGWFLVLSTNPVNAAVVYTYTGNNYNDFSNLVDPNIYDSSMNLTITFTTDNLITNTNEDIKALVTSFSAYDGINLLTEENATLARLALHTDNAGNIIEWDVRANNLPGGLLGEGQNTSVRSFNIIGLDSEDNALTEDCTIYTLGFCYASDRYSARAFDNPGTWSVVPVPPALWLFGSGLLGLVGVARKKAT